jgi:integral membrane sensor domain MASE1
LQEFPARESVTGWRAKCRYLAALLVVGLAYYGMAKLGLQLASINPSASPIWPPTGLALAAMLLVARVIAFDGVF